MHTVDWQPVIVAVGTLIATMALLLSAITPVLVQRLSAKLDVVKGSVDGQNQGLQSKVDALHAEVASLNKAAAVQAVHDAVEGASVPHVPAPPN